jgi:hypothetical protein
MPKTKVVSRKQVQPVISSRGGGAGRGRGKNNSSNAVTSRNSSSARQLTARSQPQRAKAKAKAKGKGKGKGKERKVYSASKRELKQQHPGRYAVSKQLVKVAREGYFPSAEGTDRPFPSAEEFVCRYAVGPMADGTFGEDACNTFNTLAGAYGKYSMPGFMKDKRRRKGPQPSLGSMMLNKVEKASSRRYKPYRIDNNMHPQRAYKVQEPDDDGYDSGDGYGCGGMNPFMSSGWRL